MKSQAILRKVFGDLFCLSYRKICLALLFYLFASAAMCEDAYELDWTHQLDTNGNRTSCIILDHSGNTFVAGRIENTINASNLWFPITTDIFVYKYDCLGNRLWTDTIDTSDVEYCNDIAVDGLGNLLITGYPHIGRDSGSSDYSQAFLTKYDPHGNQLWFITLDANSNHGRCSIEVDSFGNTFVTGPAISNIDSDDSMSYNAFLAKYDPEGNVLWTLQNVAGDMANILALDNVGNAYTCGTYNKFNSIETSYPAAAPTPSIPDIPLTSGPHGVLIYPPGPGIPIHVPVPPTPPITLFYAPISDGFICKYDPQGNLLWTNKFDGTKSITLTSLTINSIGEAFVTGDASLQKITLSVNKSFIAKCDEHGNLLWFNEIEMEGMIDPADTTGQDPGYTLLLNASFHTNSLKAVKSGGVFITGYQSTLMNLIDGSLSKLFIARYDLNGECLWSRMIETNRYSTSNFITVDSFGAAYICGGHSDQAIIGASTVSDRSAFVMKFRPPNVAAVADAGVDLRLPADGGCGATFVLDGSGSFDEDGDELSYYWFYDGELIGEGVLLETEAGLGEFVFTLIVNDGTEESLPDEVVITVVDDTPPEFSVQTDIQVIWPVNNKMVKVTPSFDAFDNCSSEVAIELVDIACSQESENDIEITDEGIYLRAARNAKNKEGRVYTITYKVTDESGNETTASTEIKVPHDRRRKQI